MNRWVLFALLTAVLAAGCEPSPNQLRARGISEFQLGRPEKAKQHFQTVLDTHPSDPDSLYYMGRISYLEGRYELASYYYRCCIDADPRYQQARSELAAVHKKLAETGRAPRQP